MNYTLQTNILENQISLTIGTNYGSTFHDFELDEFGKVIIDDKDKLKLICQCIKTPMKTIIQLMELVFEEAFNKYDDMILSKDELKNIYLAQKTLENLNKVPTKDIY